MTIQSYGKKAASANEACEQLILALEKMISTTDSESFVYQLNNNSQNGNPKLSVPSQLLTLTSFSKNMAEKTKGAFNPALYPITKAWGFTTGRYTVPSQNELKRLLQLTDYNQIQIQEDSISLQPGMMLDFGAVGKGYAGDLVIKQLKSQGINSALLDLGGNIQALGGKPDGGDWYVGVKSPENQQPVIGLKINNQAVITSGGYERFFTSDDGKNYIHIIDGKTGRPVDNDAASVTIVCNSGLYGDALSTALFVMGSENAIKYWQNHHNNKDEEFDFLIITKENNLIYSKGLENRITLIGSFQKVTIAE